ncbi:MAG TPA: FKBP-type peptidyl-prolyl cis-trans isomerase [Gammaproteobacteria bacterium]|nr:FKBP-type peptidyl-prolyl cis-trans isomerase [Gammaproteobacteria bacterium]
MRSLSLLACTLLLVACAGNPYLAPADVSAPPPGAQRLDSGLAYQVLRPGTGHEHPAADSIVVVNYTGWTTDGRMFDSSLDSSEPATFPLNKLIKGWQQGLPLMVTGEKARFWIPAALAYGEHPTKPGAPAGMLVFDIELLQIKH